LECAPQCDQVAGLPQRLVDLDSNSKRAVFAPAVHHFAEKQILALIDPHRCSRRKRLPKHQAQAPPGLVGCASDDRVSWWV
jgi:hypothetical protein